MHYHHKKVKVILGIILLLTALYIPLSRKSFISVEANTYPLRGFKAPEFELSDLINKSYKLSSYQEKTVVIFFWTSWCNVCKGIMPELQEFYQESDLDHFEILAINATSQDQEENAKSYAKNSQFTFPILYDLQGVVMNEFRVRAFPTAYIIDPEGVIQDIIIGSGLTRVYLLTQIESIPRN